jgi:formylglycine-generating enzyme required for sulfatase activity
MTHDVFISFSSKDTDAADKIRHGLETRGIKCWIASRDVAPGADFGESIVNAVEAAAVMVLVFSTNCNNSDEVKKELVLAGEYQLAVLPVRIENVVPSGAFRYQLTIRQYLDLFQDWDANMAKLADQIARLVAARADRPGQTVVIQNTPPQPSQPPQSAADPITPQTPSATPTPVSTIKQPASSGTGQTIALIVGIVVLAALAFAGTRFYFQRNQTPNATPAISAPGTNNPSAAEKSPTLATGDLSPGKVFTDCADCPEMTIVPPGTFQMGGERFGPEAPVHTVTISRSFAFGKTVVTQAQWRAIMGNNPSRFSSCGDNCPVERVSWNDAQNFAKKLSEKSGKNYRLPSEAEWEYACRAGGRTKYCGGDSIDPVAWHVGNSGNTTHPVATKQANPWGLYDMSGNVWQWTEDCWNTNYNGAPSNGSAWLAGECSVARVMRGGSWANDPQLSRAHSRSKYSPTELGDSLGFRVARSLP